MQDLAEVLSVERGIIARICQNDLSLRDIQSLRCTSKIVNDAFCAVIDFVVTENIHGEAMIRTVDSFHKGRLVSRELLGVYHKGVRFDLMYPDILVDIQVARAYIITIPGTLDLQYLVAVRGGNVQGVVLAPSAATWLLWLDIAGPALDVIGYLVGMSSNLKKLVTDYAKLQDSTRLIMGTSGLDLREIAEQ